MWCAIRLDRFLVGQGDTPKAAKQDLALMLRSHQVAGKGRFLKTPACYRAEARRHPSRVFYLGKRHIKQWRPVWKPLADV